MDSNSDAEQEVKRSSKHKKDKTRKSKHSKREESKDRPRDETNDADLFGERDVPASSLVNKDVVRRDEDVMLWNLAIKAAHEKAQQADAVAPSDEKSIIFLGSKEAGKTTAIFRFLERDEAPKPTTALEYTFARRAKGNNLDKDVAHIWELGGGIWLSKLAEVAISADTIKNMSVALVLDLSRPVEMWMTLEHWLQVLRTRIDAVLSDLRSSDSTLRDTLRRAAVERIGADHQDHELMDPFLLPLVILATKYDTFQDFDAEKRKVICKTLRFVAHHYGAHLQFFSSKQEALLSKTRILINHLAFNTSLGKSAPQTDHNKPLMILAGQDSLQQIGGPPLAQGDLSSITAKTPMDLWKHAFAAQFPQESSVNPSLVDDPAKDKQYAEQAVDAMRAQKDEELERYRKLSERRAKDGFAATGDQSLLKGYA